jgi:hypothetical protein
LIRPPPLSLITGVMGIRSTDLIRGGNDKFRFIMDHTDVRRPNRKVKVVTDYLKEQKIRQQQHFQQPYLQEPNEPKITTTKKNRIKYKTLLS